MSIFGRGGHDDHHERSAAERERARLEREARRAKRAGREPPPIPPPESVGPPAEPTLPDQPALDAPVPPEPEPPTEVAPAPAAGEPEPEVTWVEEPIHPPPAPDRPLAAEPPLVLPDEPAVAPVRAAPELPPRGPAARSSREVKLPSVPRPRLRLAVAAVAGIVLLWFVVSLFEPFKGDGDGRVEITIPSGASAGDVAEILEREGVVGSSFFFSARATISGKRGELKSGDYVLARDMSYGSALDALTSGPGAPKTIKITFPEGRSRREAAQLVRQAGVKGSYLEATKRGRAYLTPQGRNFSPRRYGAPRRYSSYEGFLFPATYELEPGEDAGDLVHQQLEQFRRRFAGVDLKYARSKNLNAYEVLIIASMVEREAALDKERRLIAAVIYNRLRDRMPLGIDATLRFATNNWTQPLLQSDLRLDSAYNTRTRAGLPPGPIGSPGMKSLQAAANPARVEHRYYVVKPNACGEHAFSETFEEFQQDAARYEEERQRRGGQSPTSCP